jgi:DNA-3-methyladenine glycosylase II
MAQPVKPEFSVELTQATEHLRRSDPALAPIIVRVGACTLGPHNDYFQALAGSIIGQQLSTKSAAAIRARFAALGGKAFPRPQQVMDFTFEELRAVGLSAAKVASLQDLAAHIIDGRLDVVRLPELSNEEILTEVTDVKGIGEWTAHMFLIFCLGRLDVLPAGDLGIRKGVQQLYELPALPAPLEVQAIAERNQWTGYESVASWYVWRSLDLPAAT